MLLHSNFYGFALWKCIGVGMNHYSKKESLGS